MYIPFPEAVKTLKVGDVFSFETNLPAWFQITSLTYDQIAFFDSRHPAGSRSFRWKVDLTAYNENRIIIRSPSFETALHAACLGKEVSAAQLKVLIEEISK